MIVHISKMEKIPENCTQCGYQNSCSLCTRKGSDKFIKSCLTKRPKPCPLRETKGKCVLMMK